jgi:GWxTD domain-containing protein
MRRSFKSLLVLATGILLTSPAWTEKQERKGQQSRKAVRQEEKFDHYDKWLKEDVVYIITPEEEAVFRKLSSPEEKEQFIEQFWTRRDPDPRTPTNEFREEHYRRIAYANEHFTAGFRGWMTDRGRIYIIHGPPANIESRPTGGVYLRPHHEGGGITATHPYEVWRYRHLEDIGDDIEIEFVDAGNSGLYQLSQSPWDKDASLHVPGEGQTLAEQAGLATRLDHPYFSPGNLEHYPILSDHLRTKDLPYQRYLTYAKVERPPVIKYQDLKELVTVNVTFRNLPFILREDYINLNGEQSLVPITVELENKNLSFREEQGIHVARLAIYGVITSMTNRIALEFEDEVITSYKQDDLEAGRRGRSVYQKMATLDGRMRYKLDLVVKDLNSGNTGVTRRAVSPPQYKANEIAASSLILASAIRPLPELPKQDEMFVLGDVWVYPNPSKLFSKGQTLGVYLQIYHVALDQSTLAPSLKTTYRLLKDGKVIFQDEDVGEGAMHFFSVSRVVIIKTLGLGDLAPGKYQVEVDVLDQIEGRSVTAREEFLLEG